MGGRRGGRRGGRGGRMARGRGGRGGRNMITHGRQQAGGRMMMRNGGRMIQGRGGRGGIPIYASRTFLNFLNQYNAYSVLSYLSLEERKVLGEAFPRFKVPGKKENKMRVNKQESEKVKQSLAENATIQRSQDNDSNFIGEECTAASTDPAKILDESIEKSELPGGEPTEPTPSNASAKSAKLPNVMNAKPSQSISDPHTLLARLNSKRLFRRIRLMQRVDKDFNATDAYQLNLTTEQIAIQEWQELLQQFKEIQIKKLKQAKESDTDADDKTKESPKIPSPIPSSCEMLLFSPCPRAVAVLASYPRSGNSLLRNLYERTTLRVTGSDMRGGLTKHDLVGEAAVQTNCVQFVKTHFPERRGTPPFNVSRAVLLVRNPYDAMESYFNLMTTNTHTTSLTEEQRAKSAEAFAEMAKKEILVWRDFHEYWLQQNIPLLVIRYEDLIRYTDKVIAKVIRFVLEINDMRFFESRIDRCIREEQIEKLGSYRPRSGGIGKSLSKYPPELLQTINTGILSTMEKFGYTEMLVPNPSDWVLEPMDQYGVVIPGTAEKPLTINASRLVRDARRTTNWRVVRRQMNMGGAEDNKATCSCYKCIKARGG